MKKSDLAFLLLATISTQAMENMPEEICTMCTNPTEPAIIKECCALKDHLAALQTAREAKKAALKEIQECQTNLPILMSHIDLMRKKKFKDIERRLLAIPRMEESSIELGLDMKNKLRGIVEDLEHPSHFSEARCYEGNNVACWQFSGFLNEVNELQRHGKTWRDWE